VLAVSQKYAPRRTLNCPSIAAKLERVSMASRASWQPTDCGPSLARRACNPSWQNVRSPALSGDSRCRLGPVHSALACGMPNLGGPPLAGHTLVSEASRRGLYLGNPSRAGARSGAGIPGAVAMSIKTTTGSHRGGMQGLRSWCAFHKGMPTALSRDGRSPVWSSRVATHPPSAGT